MHVLVAGQGSGSGSGSGGGTICVRGVVTEVDPGAEGLPTTIRVRVLLGHAAPPFPPPEPKQPEDVDTTPVGQDWCAHDVPVPGSSPSGTPLTVLAWSRMGTGTWSAPQSEYFYGGGPEPVECCDGCVDAGARQSAPGGSTFQSWPPPPPPFPSNLAD